MDWAKISKNIFLKRTYFVLAIIVLVAALLRLVNLDRVPVSMFGDELDVGYHAYSILKTGRDYSGNFLPIHFHSLAEWRTPLYLYSAVPTVALFGISPWGVRLPAALFGIATIPLLYFLVQEITVGWKSENKKVLGLIASFLLAISPWHIQYSRAGFEVTQLLLLIIAGILFFLVSINKKGRLLWLSAVCFALTPWVYSTAKLFIPLFIALLLVLYRKAVLNFSRKTLLMAVIAFFIVGTPIAWSTLFGGGSQRFNDINLFNDSTIEPEVGSAREVDALVNDNPKISRAFHNKYTFVGEEVVSNLLMPFSSEFLFISGDVNPRHSIEGMGVFYRVEIIALIAGVSLLFSKSLDRKKKLLIIGWIVLGVLPSSITRNGGNHATRLILILPPLLILISYGWWYLSTLNKKIMVITVPLVVIGYLLCFVSYQHLYWIHNPSQSERWWHYGWQQAMSAVKEVQSQYDSVVITSKDEPPWIFFAAWSEFDPKVWQAGYPFKKHTIEGFGEMSFIDKYSFGSFEGNKGVYDWGSVIPEKTLYVASAKEVNVNLIAEPERLPNDLKLVKAIAYPSGEPAFYLLTHAD